MAQAALGAGIDVLETETIELVPHETESLIPGEVPIGYPLVTVRFTMPDGRVLIQGVSCRGISFSLACNGQARIEAFGGISHDVPCTGEPPAGCATIPPTPRPEVVAEATAFRLAAIDIPIDRLGAYRIELGKATLPDGHLTERSFRIADPEPTTYWISPGVILEVRSDAPGHRGLGSIYDEPFDGLEPVTISLVFEVTEFWEPSALGIRGVVVREAKAGARPGPPVRAPLRLVCRGGERDARWPVRPTLGHVPYGSPGGQAR